LYRCDERLENAGTLYGELGENFAIELDALLFFKGDKARVCEAVFAERVVEADDPETSKASLFGATIAVGILSGFQDRFLGGAVVGLPAPAETRCHFEDILSSFVGGDAAFHSRHRKTLMNFK
jgi:hypothetical protein